MKLVTYLIAILCFALPHLIIASEAESKTKQKYSNKLQKLISKYSLHAFYTNVNARNSSGKTALICAAEEGDSSLIDELIEKGADINAQGDYLNSTPLICAVDTSRFLGSRFTVVCTLLKHGANPNMITLTGNTALMMASESGNIALVKELLKFGADPNLSTGYARATALSRALLAPDAARIVEELLKHGVNPNKADRSGGTPLQTITRQEPNVPLLKILLKYGANSDAKDKFGFTILMEAAYYGNIRHLTTLLKHGADTSITTTKAFGDIPQESTVFDIAKIRKKSAITTALEQHQKNVAQLRECVPNFFATNTPPLSHSLSSLIVAYVGHDIGADSSSDQSNDKGLP